MGLADVVFGSLLTLTPRLLMWRIGPRVVALAAPVVVNGLGVGAELALILHLPFWPSVGFVALGEAVVLFTGGLLVLSLIRTHGALFGLSRAAVARRAGLVQTTEEVTSVRLGRRPDELRPLSMERDVAKFADGSVLVRLGDTHVLCTAKSVDGVPGWRRGSGAGWLTAEYSMLPAATADRTPREAVRGKQGGRTQEIQRLIGRSLRAVVDLGSIGERTLYIDCDVLQADGGTRTAAVSGAYAALVIALEKLRAGARWPRLPLFEDVAAVSVGVVDGEPRLDLDYEEDAAAVARHERGHDRRGPSRRSAGHRRGRAVPAGDARPAARPGRRRCGADRRGAAGDDRRRRAGAAELGPGAQGRRRR